MKKPKSLYHNEIIGALGIYLVLHHKSLSIAKSLLVLPLIFHKDTLSFLSENNVDEIKSFVSKKTSLISNFNSRYYSLLSISLNSILIGKEMNLFTFQNSELVYLESDLPINDFGERIKLFSNVSQNVSKILTAETSELYFHLKVKI